MKEKKLTGNDEDKWMCWDNEPRDKIKKRRYVPRKGKINLYPTIILPNFLHCSKIWVLTKRKCQEALFRWQRKILRQIYKKQDGISIYTKNKLG